MRDMKKILRFSVINTYSAARAIADDILLTLTTNRYKKYRVESGNNDILETFISTVIEKPSARDYFYQFIKYKDRNFGDDEICRRIITIYKCYGNRGSKASLATYVHDYQLGEKNG